MAKEISFNTIRDTVARLCLQANLYLPDDVVAALTSAAAAETTPLAQSVYADMAQNRELAAEKRLPLCQDTGSAVVFVELGQEVCIRGGLLNEAINQGVARGYQENYLRKSIVGSLDRLNTGDNTPAIIHVEMVAGANLHLTIAPKGGGAENMSRLAMLKPSAGRPGIKEFVLETVRQAGANPCPPLVVGVGIGGNFEHCAYLAKKALLRPLGQAHPKHEEASLEKELLQEINQLNIGPQGFGGKTTALAVAVESSPCHFASLPVAVNLNCHVARHVSAVL